jgi:hypothetical protein
LGLTGSAEATPFAANAFGKPTTTESGSVFGKSFGQQTGPLENAADRLQRDKEISRLKARDAEVKAHEMAHLSAAGGYALGGPQYDYQTGPDGKRYAVGGSVKVDISPIPGDPTATVQKARTIRRAALAPAKPSAQDQRVASKAAAMEARAQRELMHRGSELGSVQKTKNVFQTAAPQNQFGGAYPYRSGAAISRKNLFNNTVPDNPFKTAETENPFATSQPKNPFESAANENTFSAMTPKSPFVFTVGRGQTNTVVAGIPSLVEAPVWAPQEIRTPFDYGSSRPQFESPEPKIASMEEMKTPTADDVLTARLRAFSVETAS